MGCKSPIVQQRLMGWALANNPKCLEIYLSGSVFPWNLCMSHDSLHEKSPLSKIWLHCDPWHMKSQEDRITTSKKLPYQLVFKTIWTGCNFVTWFHKQGEPCTWADKGSPSHEAFATALTWCVTGTRGGPVTRIVSQSQLQQERSLASLYLRSRKLQLQSLSLLCLWQCSIFIHAHVCLW